MLAVAIAIALIAVVIAVAAKVLLPLYSVCCCSLLFLT